MGRRWWSASKGLLKITDARAVAFDIARVTARRAERRLTSLPAQGRSVRPELRQFVNRLSDCLWLLAREAEQ